MGRVVDFIDIHFNKYSGNYIINLADLAAFVDLVILISENLWNKKSRSEVGLAELSPLLLEDEKTANP